MYSVGDVSVIIATFNRTNDLVETLNSFKDKFSSLKEVIVIDQSTDTLTKKFMQKIKNKKMRYVYSSTPSLTKARNIGIAHLSPNTKIVLFLDDDVTLADDYFEHLLRTFNDHPTSLGASGYYLPSGIHHDDYETCLRRIFLLEHLAKNDARVLSAYGAVYPSELNDTISAQWLSGFNMAFKKEVFDTQRFDENLSRYSLAEDFDFTYRLAQSHPHSLYITPHAKLVHRASTVERYPAKKSSYMNQIHHFYLNFKNFNRTFREKCLFFWTLFGITLLRTLEFIRAPNHRGGLKLKFYFSSLFYTLMHLQSIRQGIIHIPE